VCLIQRGVYYISRNQIPLYARRVLTLSCSLNFTNTTINMQVEYEETPATFSTSALLGEQAQVEEGQSDEEDQEDEQDQDQEEEDEEEEEQIGMSTPRTSS
jgi:hypothetical protein